MGTKPFQRWVEVEYGLDPEEDILAARKQVEEEGRLHGLTFDWITVTREPGKENRAVWRIHGAYKEEAR